jgi:hypothetical protein
VNLQVSRDHHTVPRLHLRGFCARRGPHAKEMLARHRDGTEEFIRINDATVQVDFYDPGTTSDPDDTLENWLAKDVENLVGPIMGGLRNGAVLPSSAADRERLARFVAVQMVRTIAFRDLLGDVDSHVWPLFFASDVVQKVIEADASVKDDPEMLKDLHAYYATRAPDRPGALNRASMMRTMIREADRLLPVLLGMRWLLADASTPLLLTGDTPVVTVSGTSEVTYGHLLLPDHHEIHLPLTPERLLIITPLPPLSAVTTLTAEQARLVNESIVRACANSVFRRPDMPWPPDLTLLPQRIPLRRPRVTVFRGNGEQHERRSFPSIADQKLKDALDLLGGDPDIS